MKVLVTAVTRASRYADIINKNFKVLDYDKKWEGYIIQLDDTKDIFDFVKDLEEWMDIIVRYVKDKAGCEYEIKIYDDYIE